VSRRPDLAWRLVDDRQVKIARPTGPGFNRGAIYEFIYRARSLDHPTTYALYLCRWHPTP
jgi:hypothetical protein